MKWIELILVNLIVIAFSLCFTSGYLRSIKSEVTSLNKEVGEQNLELFDLRVRVEVFEKIHVAIDFIDKTTSVEVTAVTDYFLDDPLIEEGETE